MIKPIEELKCSIISCLLWEDAFYEVGESNTDHVDEIVQLVERIANSEHRDFSNLLSAKTNVDMFLRRRYLCSKTRCCTG